MLNFLLIAAAVYVLYIWGVRLEVRAQLFGSALMNLGGYACSLAAGMACSIYVVLTAVDLLHIQASVLAVSVVSTLASILCGEVLYARISRLSFQLLAPVRSEKGER